MACSIALDTVSKRFVIQHKRNRSFQDLLVNSFRRGSSDEEFWALRDLSLEIREGETLGIIGENGSGKSTILKLIARILEPTSGRLTVNGRVAALLEIGAGFHPDLSGRDNIFLYGSVLGFSRRQLEARYGDIVEFAELAEFIDTPIKHYSSGMYMRLGFAVAINLDPDILLLDEVLAVGDERFQRKCYEKMAGLQDAGKTMILVTHDLGSVNRMCHRVLWLHDGGIGALGPPSEVVGAYLKATMDLDAPRRTAGIGSEAQTPTDLDSDGASLGESTSYDAVSADCPPGVSAHFVRDAFITGLRFFDADGHERSEFAPCERFIARIYYRARRPIRDPIFGIAIHTQSGAHVTGPNTGRFGYDIDCIDGTGEVDYVVDSLPLLPDTYEVSVAIHDRPNEQGYDWLERMWSFTVVARPEGEMPGIVSIPARWEHRATELAAVRAR